MGCEQVCLFFFLFLCQFTCLHAQLCTQEQTSALLQFKRNYSFPASWYCDASFPKMESWKTGSDCCSWDGVDCNNNTGQVIGLDLSCNGLQGTIHPNSSLFLSFPHLQKLNLAYNNFSMCRISPEFSRFTELTHLDLSGGGFSGKVPLEFSFLNKLVSLDLSFNLGLRLEEGGFKLLIQNLSRIRYLDLESVNISSVVPNSLLNRTSLTHLHLSSCALHGKFSGDIFQMPYLKSFKIVFNPALTGYFPQFVNSSSPLRYLNLANTRYPGELPDSIGNLKYLQEFYAYECQLFGSLPTSLGNLTQMTMLGLSYNNFVGVLPSSLSNLKNLNGLFLSDNNLTGPFLSLGLNVEKLTWLDLSNNSLNGTIPSWIFALPALEYLNLGYNMLIGHMDEFQSTLLRIIDVSNNNLHGAIPSSTFELVNLSHLILSSNNFSGTILESNKFRKNLAVLDLQKNNFSGIIHDPFARGNNSLKTLSLNGNGFEGPIPRSLVNSTNLKVLDLGRNKLADRFPIWLENLPCLRMLILGSNKLHGPIPSSKIQLPFPSLRVIDISDNYLNGALPEKYFKSFEAMMNVDEAQYQLEYMEDSNYMTYYYNSVTIVYKGSSIEMERVLIVFIAIDFSRNNFEGEIPNIIGRLNSIRGLNLSHNSLTSHIPTSLGNLTKLEWLDLSSNKLTGEIPRQLTNLISLGTLNLSQNRLTGPIPRGKQFDTFSNDSYINNLALCGPPLTNTCGDPKATQPPPSTYEEEDSEPASGFGWEVILPGYGFGLVVGLVMGYLMFSFRKPLWLVMMVEGVGNRNGKRRKSNPRRRGGRRNLQIANGIV